jgi:hypothetical protein
MSILDLQGMQVPGEIRQNGPPAGSRGSKGCTVSGGGGSGTGSAGAGATASSLCIGPIDLL